MHTTTSATNLLLRKMLVAFLVAFGGVLIPALLSILNNVAAGTPSKFGKALLISLVAGAFSAGLRAALALSPINLTPTDKLTTLGSSHKSVTVSKA